MLLRVHFSSINSIVSLARRLNLIITYCKHLAPYLFIGSTYRSTQIRKGIVILLHIFSLKCFHFKKSRIIKFLLTLLLLQLPRPIIVSLVCLMLQWGIRNLLKNRLKWYSFCHSRLAFEEKDHFFKFLNTLLPFQLSRCVLSFIWIFDSSEF